MGALPTLVAALPARQLIYFWLAIFGTFSMIGFVLDILGQGRQPATLLALNVIASGLISVGYAMVSMPARPWGYAAMITIHVTYVLRSEEHTSELQSLRHLVCRLLL